MTNFLYTLIIYPVYEIIEVAFVLFYRVFKNPGIATIGVSIAVTLLCLPLYIVAERWQDAERKIQAKLKPGISRIKTTFKGDEQYMILSTYYKQNHYHPMMALRSSFSLLIQIPFFMAAYSYLSHLEILRGFSFAFIRDMGKPDALFTVGGFAVNVLPIAMTLINCVAGAIYAHGHSAREKIQIYGMAAVFLVILYNSPAGLVLYWTMNNVLSLVKNVFYKFKNPAKALYFTLVAFVAVGIIYLLGFNGGTLKKRILAAIALLPLLPIPLYIKAVGKILDKFLYNIIEDNKKRFELFIFSAVALCLLTGLIIPTSLISSSVQEFSDIKGDRSPLYFVFNTLTQSAGLYIIWPLCIYFLFHSRIQTIIAVVVSVALIFGVIDTYAFPGNYGSMNNTLMFIDGFKQPPYFQTVLNAFILCAVLVSLLLIYRRFPKAACTISSLLILPLLVIGISNSLIISSSYKKYKMEIAESTQTKDSIAPLYKFTKSGKNVFIIMLDRAESSFVESIFNERPELREEFSGFTYYKNTLSYNGHTLISAPSIFGGYEFTPYELNKRRDVSNLEKNTQALMTLPLIFTSQPDWDARVSDLPWAGYSLIPDMRIVQGYPKITGFNSQKRYTDLWKKKHQELDANPDAVFNGIKRNLLWFGFFRTSPVVLREMIYYEAKWWSLNANKDIDIMLNSYSVLEFLPQLTEIDSDRGNHLTIMENELSHENYPLLPPDYIPANKIDVKSAGICGNITGYSGNAASYILLAKWFDYLKRNGCYDNTRIILVSDHGIGNNNAEFADPKLTSGYPKDHFHAVLFVKDFDAEGDIKMDYGTFMTTADVPTIALKGIIENPVNPFTNNPINDNIKHQEGAIITESNRHQPGDHLHSNYFTIEDNEWWTVKDNIFESKNWKQGVSE